MDHPIDLHSFPDRETLVTELTTVIADLLSEGVSRNDRASLFVSGGSTPVQLFKSLSIQDLPWPNIDIFLVDERWVSPTAKDSNELLVKTHLLQNRAAAANFTGMWSPIESARDGEIECAKQIQKIQRPFDVLILGLGNDGHTASLFPGAARLELATNMDSGKICLAITPVNAPHERMTLTLPAILESKRIFLHINGQNKKDVLEQALKSGPAEEMPIRFIVRNAAPELKNNCSIYWAK